MEEIKYKVIGYKNGILIYSNEYLTYDAAYRKFAEKAHWEGLMMSGTVDYLCIDEISENFFYDPNYPTLRHIDTLESWNGKETSGV